MTDFLNVIKNVEKRIPQEIRDDLALRGWNAFGIFEVVLDELKKAKEPICCPHCITICVACQSARGRKKMDRFA